MTRRGDRIRKNGSRFGERVVRDGRIRWLGRDFVPLPDRGSLLATQAGDAFVAGLTGEGPKPDLAPVGEYDGRFDGRVATFYRYGELAERMSPVLRDKVWLHSFVDESSEGGMEWPGPNCINGVFRWETWVPVSVRGADTPRDAK